MKDEIKLLVEAVHQYPDDDSPRYALADKLIESSDRIDNIRGRFIAAQIAIATGNPTEDDLAFNDIALRSPVCTDVWRRSEPCSVCRGHGRYLTVDLEGNTIQSRTECAQCYGTGDSGGLLRQMSYSNGTQELAFVTWRKGFIERVNLPTLYNVINASGQRYLLQLIKPNPYRVIKQIYPNNCRPHYRNGGYLWFEYRGEIALFNPCIPSEIFRYLSINRMKRNGVNYYPNERSAEEDLGKAVIDYAKELYRTHQSLLK